ncbi:MAG: hypothetical protein JWO13_2017 [Acidobacteriales bacterium]|nr:hypothetical protein [Terriglobales bacterium]
MTHPPTPQQRRAVEHLHGPMLVVAGAGSGKTKVLVARIANLIRNHNVAPEEILAVTYTDNAAANIRARVQDLLGSERDISGLQTETFHSYCNSLLVRHERGFKLVDGLDLKVYLNLRVPELPLKHFTKAASPGQFISDLLDFNTRCQDDLIGVAEYQRYIAKLESDPSIPLPRVAAAKLMADMHRDEVLARCREIASVYDHVEKLLRSKGWGTYGHMIVDAVALLQDKKILSQERQRTRFILIDEFQDSNFGQIELAQLLAGDTANIFAVGDPDQAIYRFRGATSEAFEEFKRRFPKMQQVTLDHNFRSVPAVLKTAFAVISKNFSLERKPLISGRAEEAKKTGHPLPDFNPEAVVTPDHITEAKTLIDSIVARREETGLKWSDFAILYRAHKNRAEVVTECAERGIPLDVRGVDVLGSSEVRDLLAAIRIAITPDDSVSIFRLAALPQFKIDPVKLQFALTSAKRGTAVDTVLREVPNGKNLLDALAVARKQIASMKLNASASVELLIKTFALPVSAPQKAFRKFVSDWEKKPIAEKGDLEEFVTYLDCYIAQGGKVCLPDSDSKTAPDSIQLMTVHSAKGLEFKHVYIVRVNQGTFPPNNRDPLFEFPQALSRSKASDLPTTKELHDAEERRLFYVGITRSEDSVAIYGKLKGKGPTGYVKELIANKELKGIISVRNITETRFDIHASAPAYVPIGRWLMMPSLPRLAKLKLSATAIDSYDSCTLRYKIEREWQIPGELAAAQQYGSAVHTVLRAYYEAVRAGKMLELETVLTCFRDAIQNAGIADQHQLKLYTEQGLRQLTVFVESRAGQPQPKVLATEKAFEFEVGGVSVQGRMDRIDELSDSAVAIEDYKAGAAKNEEHADKSMQLTVYALAAKSLGKSAERLTFYSLENNVTVATQRTDDELAEAEEKISEIAAGIRAGDFNPKEGRHCSWCPYTSICPAKEEALFQIGRAAGSVQ